MTEKLGKNVVYVGSFNPVHIGHIKVMEYGLEKFDYLKVFVRYNEGFELTDWETKKGFFEQIAKDLGAEDRVAIYKEVTDEKGKKYNINQFFDFIREAEIVVGEKIDGFLFGNDYENIRLDLEREFPDTQFIIVSRDGGINSSKIRGNLEEYKDWLKPYVYEELARRKGKTNEPVF